MIEEDDTNPLIQLLASRIAEFEKMQGKVGWFARGVVGQWRVAAGSWHVMG
ncbi:hypothetical protein ACNKHR_19670 [Shigella flexneri]